MACPGGCTNGGGQIKADDDIILLNQVQIQNQNQPPSTTTMEKSKVTLTLTPSANREWLQKVDEAYWSDDDDYSAPPSTPTPSLSHAEVSPEDKIKALMSDFENATRVGIEKVLWTKYKKVEDEFNRDRVNGKDKEEEVSSVVRVAELAARSGGGW